MINTIVCYDDNDDILGDYFMQSYDVLNEYIANIDDTNVLPIAGLNCTEDHLIETIDSFEEEGFVFVGLMHGNEQQLGTSNDLLVDIENVNHFKKSLFYSLACSTAIELGKELITKGCISYVGYNQDTLATYEEHNETYINCESYCLKEFLSTNQPIGICFDNMMDYFDQQIDILSDENDEILIAMELVGNKNSFVLLGNRDLTKSDIDT